MAGLVPLGFDLAVIKFHGLYDLLLHLVTTQVIRSFLLTVPVQPGADWSLSGTAEAWEAPLAPPHLSTGIESSWAFTECPQFCAKSGACV